MRGSLIWFALAAAWGLDSVLAAFRRNWVQGALAGFFALCFLAIGLVFRNRETRVKPRQRAPKAKPGN